MLGEPIARKCVAGRLDMRQKTTETEYINTDFHFTLFLTGHGAFADYLKRFKRVDCDKCKDCGLVADGVLHKIFLSDSFRLTREMVDTEFGADCSRIKVSDLEERGFRDLLKLGGGRFLIRLRRSVNVW